MALAIFAEKVSVPRLMSAMLLLTAAGNSDGLPSPQA
jgi:hypothetical protein